jgi:tRNA-dihydrouridine synthase B
MGRPWIFREIAHHLATGETLAPPTLAEIHALLRAHLLDHYAFYGEHTGVRTARKHVGWYLAGLPAWQALRAEFNRIESPKLQLASIDRLHDALAAQRRPAKAAAANDGIHPRRQVA